MANANNHLLPYAKPEICKMNFCVFELNLYFGVYISESQKYECRHKKTTCVSV